MKIKQTIIATGRWPKSHRPQPKDKGEVQEYHADELIESDNVSDIVKAFCKCSFTMGMIVKDGSGLVCKYEKITGEENGN